jgi:hypothetical protein
MTLKISLHDEIGKKEDIIKYIESVVRSDRSMRRWKEEDKRLLVDTLSDKSDGMYAYLISRLGFTVDPHVILKVPLGGLPG